MVKVETHWIGTFGESQSVTTSELTDNGAAFYAENVNDSARDFGRRVEIFQTGPQSSVQCVYDSEGNIWRAIEYRQI